MLPAWARARRNKFLALCVGDVRGQVQSIMTHFRFLVNWVGFFILGTINNFGYVVITSAAQSLSDSFHERNLIGLIPWANVALSLVVRSINAFFLDWMPYKWRMLINSTFLILGLVGLSLSVYVDFWFALSMIVIVGGTSSFGESMLLGYMNLYPAKVVDGWSSGTGMAGVAGSAYYLGLSAAGLSNEWIFMSLIPSALIYYVTYALVLRRPGETNVRENSCGHNAEVPSEEEGECACHSTLLDGSDVYAIQVTDTPVAEFGIEVSVSSLSGDEADPLLLNEEESGPFEKENPFLRVWRCWKLVWWRALMLFLVYVFEYVASTGGADKAESQHPDGWAEKHAYTILSFCYQAGVLVSRSSLSCLKVRRIEILTLLQALNMVLWILQDEYKFMMVWVQFPLMVYVGLLGGAMYVNVFYLLLHDEAIPQTDRELCVNLVALAITGGITIASIAVVLMDETFLSDK